MKYIAIFLCLVGLVVAQGYTDWQQGAAEGLKYGFRMGQAYQEAQSGINVTGFNAQVDIYNAWVREHFGEDLNLLMKKLDAPVDLSKPVLIANNTTQGGIVHAIDGSTAPGASYTTNDMNLLPASVTNSSTFKKDGGQWLGGV
ncbi:MAG: hypothetical protein PHW87_08365 [Methanothrix sp.]|nr:hypothetical protein [Methanothrix sp.]